MTDNTVAKPAGAAIVRRPRHVRLLWLVAVLAALLVACALSVAIGSRSVSWAEIVGAFGGSTDTLGEAAVAKRIPRTLLALLAGAALGLAGGILQGVTRNPLADPYILGINMGASLAVVIGIAWFGLASAQGYIWTAIFGAMLAAILVHAIASLGRGGATPLKLALAGAATTVAFSSFITAVVLQRNDISGSVQSWELGGVGGATYDSIFHFLPFVIVGLAISLVAARSLNALALGDELAAGLGENVVVARALSALGAVMLCGAATAVCGPIGFVGLVVPHFCRVLVGLDHRWLLPFCALTGALLLIGADVIGRVVARPTELDVGVVTAFVGAPIFIWIVRRHRMREL